MSTRSVMWSLAPVALAVLVMLPTLEGDEPEGFDAGAEFHPSSGYSTIPAMAIGVDLQSSGIVGDGPGHYLL